MATWKDCCLGRGRISAPIAYLALMTEGWDVFTTTAKVVIYLMYRIFRRNDRLTMGSRAFDGAYYMLASAIARKYDVIGWILRPIVEESYPTWPDFAFSREIIGVPTYFIPPHLITPRPRKTQIPAVAQKRVPLPIIMNPSCWPRRLSAFCYPTLCYGVLPCLTAFHMFLIGFDKLRSASRPTLQGCHTFIKPQFVIMKPGCLSAKRLYYL